MKLMILLLAAAVAVAILLVVYTAALKRGIRMMTRELERTRELSYNRQLTVSLFDRDLTEQAAALNRNLDYQRQLKLQYEQSQRQMKQSISDIAHDLRTPLTVVKGNLQLLGDEETLTEKGERCLRVSLDKTNVLRDMIDTFFELSVLESDETQVELQTIPVTNHLMQFLIDHETVIREHGLTPDIQLPEKSLFIRADRTMLDRMLGNLLGNVLKYARDTFQVSLECPPPGESCSIAFSNRVADGLPIEAERLFDRSYQDDRARSTSGAGLGLYIVKLLADKQGAHVSAMCEDGELTLRVRFLTAERPASSQPLT